jgi:branched-chain amino acid transport system substrate-binding protein
VFGDVSFTPERHDGYPDEGIVMVEANSLKNGAFKLAPGYDAWLCVLLQTLQCTIRF